MNDIKYVLKRDTKRVSFDKRKIAIAIFKAAEATEGNTMRLANAEKIAQDVVDKLIEKNIVTPDIETIQDYVETELLNSNYKTVANNYIRYREKRNSDRKSHDLKIKI